MTHRTTWSSSPPRAAASAGGFRASSSSRGALLADDTPPTTYRLHILSLTQFNPPTPSHSVTSLLHFVDPTTLTRAELPAAKYWRQPLDSVMSSKDLVQFEARWLGGIRLLLSSHAD